MTDTRTRRQVKLDQYGIVRVAYGGTEVGITSGPYTAEQLREAAHILNQIAEVLDDDTSNH